MGGHGCLWTEISCQENKKLAGAEAETPTFHSVSIHIDKYLKMLFFFDSSSHFSLKGGKNSNRFSHIFSCLPPPVRLHCPSNSLIFIWSTGTSFVTVCTSLCSLIDVMNCCAIKVSTPALLPLNAQVSYMLQYKRYANGVAAIYSARNVCRGYIGQLSQKLLMQEKNV